jgi:hypothetical protein
MIPQTKLIHSNAKQTSSGKAYKKTATTSFAKEEYNDRMQYPKSIINAVSKPPEITPLTHPII